MTIRKNQLSWVFVFAALIGAADQPWKGKPVAEWTENDAKQVLSDSPWVKSVIPTIKKQANGRQGSRGMGRSGARIGGIGGPQIGGRGGTGRGVPQASPETGGTPPTLTVRWESALPIQAARLKIRDVNSLPIEEGFYTIAVYGLPGRMAAGDPQALEGRLKHEAELKRDGKKTIRSSDARALSRDEGLIVLFLFPRNQEITQGDRRIEFAAHIGALELTQIFELSETTYAGKLEL